MVGARPGLSAIVPTRKAEENTAQSLSRSLRTPSLLTVGLKDTEDLVAGDGLDLGDTLRVTEDNTDLRGGETATGELEDLVGDLLGGGLEPRGGSARVGERGGGDALALGVHAALSVPRLLIVKEHDLPAHFAGVFWGFLVGEELKDGRRRTTPSLDVKTARSGCVL